MMINGLLAKDYKVKSPPLTLSAVPRASIANNAETMNFSAWDYVSVAVMITIYNNIKVDFTPLSHKKWDHKHDNPQISPSYISGLF